MKFITKISLDQDIERDAYPFNLPILKKFEELEIKSPVTFFVGENGSGKSTLIEAIAIASGLNPEGGSQNFNFKTTNSYSELYKKLIISKTGDRPKTKYFLRAESFYNVASEIERAFREDGNIDMLISHGGKSLHNCSHGEAFITLIENRFYDKGLYILDEPEAALSPLRQMQLLILIDKLVKNGSQLIIATHSPILLSYPNATIHDFDNNMEIIKYEDTENYKLYKMFIENPKRMIEKLLED